MINTNNWMTPVYLILRKNLWYLAHIWHHETPLNPMVFNLKSYEIYKLFWWCDKLSLCFYPSSMIVVQIDCSSKSQSVIRTHHILSFKRHDIRHNFINVPTSWNNITKWCGPWDYKHGMLNMIINFHARLLHPMLNYIP